MCQYCTTHRCVNGWLLYLTKFLVVGPVNIALSQNALYVVCQLSILYLPSYVAVETEVELVNNNCCMYSDLLEVLYLPRFLAVGYLGRKTLLSGYAYFFYVGCWS